MPPYGHYVLRSKVFAGLIRRKKGLVRWVKKKTRRQRLNGSIRGGEYECEAICRKKKALRGSELSDLGGERLLSRNTIQEFWGLISISRRRGSFTQPYAKKEKVRDELQLSAHRELIPCERNGSPMPRGGGGWFCQR